MPIAGENIPAAGQNDGAALIQGERTASVDGNDFFGYFQGTPFGINSLPETIVQMQQPHGQQVEALYGALKVEKLAHEETKTAHEAAVAQLATAEAAGLALDAEKASHEATKEEARQHIAALTERVSIMEDQMKNGIDAAVEAGLVVRVEKADSPIADAPIV